MRGNNAGLKNQPGTTRRSLRVLAKAGDVTDIPKPLRRQRVGFTISHRLLERFINLRHIAGGL